MTITVEQLFEHQVHLGHTKDRWNPKMRSVIHSTDKGIHVIDLESTKHELERAVELLKKAKSTGKKVLFVGTKPQAQFVIQQEFKNTNLLYVDEKWSPGLLTNFKVIRERVDYYRQLKDQFESGEIKKYTKKEVAKFKKDLDKLDAIYHGVIDMRSRPDVLVVLDAVGNKLAIKEAQTCGIPIIALVDTNADPEGITIPVPANDDSVTALRFLLQTLVSALV